MKTKILNTTCSILMLIFLSAFGFQDNAPKSGWYQQFMPDLNNRPLSDITFVDSLTGFAVTGDNTVGDTNFIIKTSNGGDNWSIIHSVFRDLRRVIFLDENTGYVCGGLNTSGSYLVKTIDGGNSWSQLNSPNSLRILDMHVLSEDTIWIVEDMFSRNVFRTTNGGMDWELKYTTGDQINKIYFFNEELGFLSKGSSGHTLLRTINNGTDWDTLTGENGFRDIYFVDSLTGWKTLGDTMKFTTNGGFNWTNQTLPVGGNISSSYMTSFYNLNKDTIWGVGGFVNYGINGFRGILHFTSNKGMTWYYQIPDTSIRAGGYRFINFINNNIGWAYSGNTGIHTVTGGDTTFYTGIVNISNEVPSDFMLHQNYPNPFNPRTVIRYALTKSANVTLKVYDVTGREYTTLVNDFQRAGVYEVDFMGKFTASGVYFYRLSAGDFSDTKRMLLLK